MTSWRQPSASRIVSRAYSSSDLDSRPSAWGLFGFAHSSSPSAKASRAAGMTGVVEAWSK